MGGIYHPGYRVHPTTLGIQYPPPPWVHRHPAYHCRTHRTGQHRSTAGTALTYRVAETNISDGGVTDAGVTDAGCTDAGVTDAGVTDAGVVLTQVWY